jgi:hypothetical protein
MHVKSILEIFKAAGITNAERSNDNSALGVSLTDSGILKLAAYTSQLTPDLKRYLDYKLPYVQARAEARKQREAEQRQREAERQAQASAELDQHLIARLKRSNPSISDAEIKEMLPELRKRHFLAEIERQEDARTRSARGLLTVA